MHKTQFDHARFDFSPRNLTTNVSTICQVNLTQSIALEQKRLDLRSFSPAPPNLWSLLVYAKVKIYFNFHLITVKSLEI